MRFHKYHALGNDYIVIDADSSLQPSAARIRTLCDRHFGLGGDGVLWGPLWPGSEDLAWLSKQVGGSEVSGFLAGLRIFNPDGGGAEKSGNGLRIFSRYLFDKEVVAHEAFQLLTWGGVVESRVLQAGQRVRVAMGRVDFRAAQIPVTGEDGEVLERRLRVEGAELVYSAANIGNPHCVVVVDDPAESLHELVCRFGPVLEEHEIFPQRINVQFMRVLDRQRLQIEIWERGAGYTLASGTSASACAAVARRLGLVAEEVEVVSPGGVVKVAVDSEFQVVLEGDVTAVASGQINAEMFGDR